jgi:hypothetical protein
LPAGLIRLLPRSWSNCRRGGSKESVIAEKDQALAAAEAIIQQLKEALRLERIRK